MSNAAWLIVALAIVFVAIGGYSAWIATRRERLERRLRQMRGEGH